jgi:phosphomannomutase/phosphoglucomutase
MITGSHNPAEYNGLKICLKDGTIYGDQIQEIANFIKTKKIISGEGQYSTLNVEDTYINWVADNIQLKNKLSIVVDSGNGMAGKIAPKLYKKLGCEVKELFSELDGTFPNHHPDPTENKNLTHIMRELKNKKYHVGIAFDGDADRIGAIDSTGTPLFGDELLVIYSRELLKRKPGGSQNCLLRTPPDASATNLRLAKFVRVKTARIADPGFVDHKINERSGLQIPTSAQKLTSLSYYSVPVKNTGTY